MDPIWFGIMLLLNMDVAAISPPFGLTLFVFQGVAPPHMTMRDIYTGVLPVFLMEVLVLALLLVFPGLTLFLVSLMGK
jgi:TRAP-type mannitol/chloroaromatic compound transport system permease large subunit